MGGTLPSVPWSCKGCPVVSWRSWLGDKVNLLPWNCRVTGVSGWEIRFWLPAMLASWAIFTTSPPSIEMKNRHVIKEMIKTDIFTVINNKLHQLLKGEKEAKHAEPGWINQRNKHSHPPQQNHSSSYFKKPWRGKKMAMRVILRWDREPETYIYVHKALQLTAFSRQHTGHQQVNLGIDVKKYPYILKLWTNEMVHLYLWYTADYSC